MGIKVKLPIVIIVDNMGAIFMAENVSVSQRTKHIDLRARFINQYVEDGFVKIIFVRTTENLSDGFTKNVSGEIYDKMTESYVGVREYWSPDQSGKGVRGTLTGLFHGDFIGLDGLTGGETNHVSAGPVFDEREMDARRTTEIETT
jgi:hypothetical protein